MIKSFDINRHKSEVRLYLCKPNRETICELNEAYGVKTIFRYSGIHELSFNIPYIIEKNKEFIKNDHVNLIRGHFLIRYEEIDENGFTLAKEYFIINKPKNTTQDGKEIKFVNCFLQPYGDLRGKHIRDYKGTKRLYDPVGTNGILNETLLAKTDWSVEYVDSAITEKYRTFDVSQKNLLEFMEEIQDTFDVVVVWKTETKKVSFYKNENLGTDKGLTIEYGKYLKAIDEDPDFDNVATQLYAYGKDGLSISRINPTGSPYVENLNYYMYPFQRDVNKNVIKSSAYMTDDLCHALLDYYGLLDSKKPVTGVAEIGTSETTIKMTNHGLVNGDFIVNTTKNFQYAKVTVIDANTIQIGEKGQITNETSGLIEVNSTYSPTKIGYDLKDFVINKSTDGTTWVTAQETDYIISDIGIITNISNTSLYFKINYTYSKNIIEGQASGNVIYKYKDGTIGKLLYKKQDLQKQITSKQNELSALNLAMQIIQDDLDIAIANGDPVTDLNTQKSNKQTEIDNKQSEIDALNSQISALHFTFTVNNGTTADGVIELTIDTVKINVNVANGDLPANVATKIATAINKLPNLTATSSSNSVTVKYCTTLDGVVSSVNAGSTSANITPSIQTKIGVDVEIEVFKDDISIENNFTPELIVERNSFLNEYYWSDSKFINEEELYNDAVDRLSRICQPIINYEIDIVDFTKVAFCEQDWDKLNLGDIITVRYPNFEIDIKAKIISIEQDHDANSIKLQIANDKDIKSGFLKLKDLLNKSVTSSISVDMSKYKWDKSEENNSLINEVVNQKWNANKQAIVAGKNESYTLDERGLTLKDPSDAMNFLRALHNILAFTNDGGNTYKHAITPQGIVGENIYGKLGVFAKVLADQIIVGENGEKLPDSVIDSSTKWNNTSTEYDNFVTQTYPDDLAAIQSQIDGNITSWFYDYEPTLTNLPASDWVATDTVNNNDVQKIAHLGDLFYNTITGYSYRFINHSTEGFKWLLLSDSGVQKALEDAAKAQDTADAKRRVFVVTPIPPYDVGDLWIKSGEVDVYYCTVAKALSETYSTTDWSTATAAKSYTDTQITKVNNSITNLQNDVNNFSNDGLLTLAEANSLKNSLDQLNAESTDLKNTGTNLGITTEVNNYNSAINSLTNELNKWLGKTYPLDISTSGTTRETIKTKFDAVQDAKSKLINKVMSTRESNATAVANAAKDRAIDAENNAKSYTDKHTGNLVNNTSVTGMLDGWTKVTTYGTLTMVDKSFESRTVKVHQLYSSNDSRVESDYIDIDPSKGYEVTLWMSADATTGNDYFGMYAYDEGFAQINVDTISIDSNNTVTTTTNPYFWNGDNAPTWTKRTAYIMPTGTTPSKFRSLGLNVTHGVRLFPNVTKMKIRYLNYYNTNIAKNLWVANMVVTEMGSSEIKSIIDLAQAQADLANQKLTDMASDNIITPQDRVGVADELKKIVGAVPPPTITNVDAGKVGELYTIRDEAVKVGLPTVQDSPYDVLGDKYEALRLFLDGLGDGSSTPKPWSTSSTFQSKNITLDTQNKTNWDTRWKEYYQAFVNLRKAISEKIKADAQSSLDLLADMGNDLKIIKQERFDIKDKLSIITGETGFTSVPLRSGLIRGEVKSILDECLALNIDESSFSYKSFVDAYDNLADYLNNDSNFITTKAWDTNSETNITLSSGDIWDQKWNDYYSTYAELRLAIAQKLKDDVDTAQETADTVASNFNARNDRIDIVPANPVVSSTGTTIDHTVNSDGSCDLSFEWSYDGFGDAYNIDGFIVYLHSTRGGLNDPTVAPTLSLLSGTSSLTVDKTYYVRYTWSGSSGETLASSIQSITISSIDQYIKVTVPVPPAGTKQTNVYMGFSANSLYLQGTIMAPYTAYSRTTEITTSGNTLPTVNSSGKLYRFDSGARDFANEQLYYVDLNKRAFILYGVSADKNYTFGIQAYRMVDDDIAGNVNGMLKSSIVQSTTSGEDPYLPSTNVAFTGNVAGTINGVDAATVQSQASTAYEQSSTPNINLLYNGGAEIYTGKNGTNIPDGWNTWQPSNLLTFKRRVNDSSWTMSGKASFEIEYVGSSTTNANGVYYQDYTTVKSGEKYTFSAMLDGHRCNVWLKIEPYNGYTMLPIIEGNKAQGKRLEKLTFTIPNNCTKIRLCLAKGEQSLGSTSSYLFADQVKLEKGEIYTPFIETGDADGINGGLQQGVLYNKVVTTKENGVEVFDNSNKRAVQMGAIDVTNDGNADKYGIKAIHSDGSFTALTQDGLQRWVNGEGKNYFYLVKTGTDDSSHNSMLFNFKEERYPDGGGIMSGEWWAYNFGTAKTLPTDEQVNANWSSRLISLPLDFQNKNFSIVLIPHSPIIPKYYDFIDPDPVTDGDGSRKYIVIPDYYYQDDVNSVFKLVCEVVMIDTIQATFAVRAYMKVQNDASNNDPRNSSYDLWCQNTLVMPIKFSYIVTV